MSNIFSEIIACPGTITNSPFSKIYPKMFNNGVDVMIISRESKMDSLNSYSKKYVS